MSDTPQPTPGRDTTVREAIAQQIQYAMDEAKAIDKYFGDFDGVKKDRTDDIMQIVIAEQTRLLESLPVTGIIGSDGIRREYVPLSAIDAKLQQLRAGHEPDGGEG